MNTTSFESVKQKYERISPCGHSAGIPIITKNGIKLPTCTGSSARCKIQAFNMLGKDLQKYCNKAEYFQKKNRNLHEEIMRMKDEIIRLTEQVENPREKNKIVNNFNAPISISQNTYYVNMSENISEYMLEAKNKDLSHPDVENGIYNICKQKNTTEAREIVELVESNDTKNIALGKMKIHNMICKYDTNDDVCIKKFIGNNEAKVVEYCNENNIEIY